MDVGTIVVVLTGMLVIGMLAWQAATGALMDPTQRQQAVTAVATRPDLRPVPRRVRTATQTAPGTPRRAA